MIDFVEVGNMIQNKRREMKLSQDELASKLYITRQALSKWENGTSIPSIDSLFELCKIFSISFEEILCLNHSSPIDPDNIFNGHERNFVIEQIISNKINVDVSDVLYQMSPSERLAIIKAVKEGKIKVDMEEFLVKLTKAENRYLLGGNYYEIKKSDCRW